MNRESTNGPAPVYKIIVSNLDPKLNDDDLLYFFEQLGSVKSAAFNDGYKEDDEIPEGITRTAVIAFKKSDDIKKALKHCNGFHLLRYDIKVENYNGSSFISSHGSTGEARIDLDSADDQGIKLDGATRLALMNRLNRSNGPEPSLPVPKGKYSIILLFFFVLLDEYIDFFFILVQTPPISSPSSSIVAHVPIPVMTKPTVYINLNNMFDPSEYVKYEKLKNIIF